MRQNYFKNAALLTGSDVVLRLAGMGLRIWLANALGGAGMGLYQLVLAVYGLFVTLATAGISVAATRLMAEDNGSQLQQLRRNLAQALREEVTERQKQVLFLYYNQGLTMREIGAALGVDRSTVSRTIKRGEARLHRCLRYGGAALLRGALGEEGRKNFRHAVDKRVFRGR